MCRSLVLNTVQTYTNVAGKPNPLLVNNNVTTQCVPCISMLQWEKVS